MICSQCAFDGVCSYSQDKDNYLCLDCLSNKESEFVQVKRDELAYLVQNAILSTEFNSQSVRDYLQRLKDKYLGKEG